MKKLFWILGLILDEAYKENKGKLFIAPLAVAAIVQGAITVGAKIKSDIEAKKAAEKLDQEKKAENARLDKIAERSTNVAKNIAKTGDPTLNEKLRRVDQSAANVVGKATASSGSTQEIINAAQKTQEGKDAATNAALNDASNFRFKASEMLASRFGQEAQTKLQGKAVVNQEAQQALAAISGNAQAGVDSVQNLGGLMMQGVAAQQMYGGGGGGGSRKTTSNAPLKNLSLIHI